MRKPLSVQGHPVHHQILQANRYNIPKIDVLQPQLPIIIEHSAIPLAEDLPPRIRTETRESARTPPGSALGLGLWLGLGLGLGLGLWLGLGLGLS